MADDTDKYATKGDPNGLMWVEMPEVSRGDGYADRQGRGERMDAPNPTTMRGTSQFGCEMA